VRSNFVASVAHQLDDFVTTGLYVHGVEGPSNDYGIPHNPHVFQDVLNQSWPAPHVAERIKDHASIDVTVRVEFKRDGETWLDGTATRWHGEHVFVRVENEPRLRLPFVWVHAENVRRRPHGPLSS
jgi:hypothetical protein